ncbi:MAG: hypothetical protein ACK417_09705 [Bacteroidia bacterium]
MANTAFDLTLNRGLMSSISSQDADFVLRIFPNPAHDDIHMQFNNHRNKAGLIEVSHISGQLSKQMHIEPGQEHCTMSISELPWVCTSLDCSSIPAAAYNLCSSKAKPILVAASNSGFFHHTASKRILDGCLRAI